MKIEYCTSIYGFRLEFHHADYFEILVNSDHFIKQVSINTISLVRRLSPSLHASLHPRDFVSLTTSSGLQIQQFTKIVTEVIISYTSELWTFFWISFEHHWCIYWKIAVNTVYSTSDKTKWLTTSRAQSQQSPPPPPELPYLWHQSFRVEGSPLVPLSSSGIVAIDSSALW